MTVPSSPPRRSSGGGIGYNMDAFYAGSHAADIAAQRRPLDSRLPTVEGTSGIVMIRRVRQRPTTGTGYDEWRERHMRRGGYPVSKPGVHEGSDGLSISSASEASR
jgi:hypothetical protein